MVSHLPPISSSRLDRADGKSRDHPLDRHTVVPRLPSGAHDATPDHGESTILYLAFGSNLCAETFQGKRGIRPLRAINVMAPSLTLVFDLPGVPYLEPCEANTAPRALKNPDGSIPGAPGVPGGGPAPTLPDALIGVVYEVTAEDYAKIIATEGGGNSYLQIVVPCLPLAPSVTIPEKPAVPDKPRPFLARTLYIPRIPDGPDNGDDGDDGDGGEAPQKKWKWLLNPHRPDPYYAQPSLRYLNLLRSGAAEHDLPQAYQNHLQSLQPYTATTLRQKIGGYVMMVLFIPWLFIIFGLGSLVSDKSGRSPAWIGALGAVLFNFIWSSYDNVFKGIFGDGERTVEDDEGYEGEGDVGNRQPIRLTDEERGVASKF